MVQALQPGGEGTLEPPASPEEENKMKMFCQEDFQGEDLQPPHVSLLLASTSDELAKRGGKRCSRAK